MSQLTILIASADDDARAFLAAQLDADGHEVFEAASATATTAKLCTHAIDVLLLADLERAPDAPTLLRALRDGRLHTRVHPAQPAITIGATDELSTLRAYRAGSDHHVDRDSGFLILRAVIQTVARRALEDTTTRHLHIGELHIDTAARRADINGSAVKLSRTEFELLTTLARQPTKVFTKAELSSVVWGHPRVTGRTLDSHIARLRRHLSFAGARMIHNAGAPAGR